VAAPVQDEKASRTPAQRKLSSQLLFEIYRRRGEAEQKGVPPGARSAVKVDSEGRALVDVRAPVVPGLLKAIGDLGATIVSSSVEYRSTLAWIPLLQLERLAEDPTVVSIAPAAEAQLSRP
jgi:hypothetical protein